MNKKWTKKISMFVIVLFVINMMSSVGIRVASSSEVKDMVIEGIVEAPTSSDINATGETQEGNNISIVDGTDNVEGKVNEVIINPLNNSQVKAGQTITLSTDTKDAVIKYSVNGSEFKDYNDSDKLILNELPATIQTYAVKDGLEDSIINTYNYTQAHVENVTASPNGSTVKVGDTITLTCGTEESLIKYSLDGGNTWNEYNNPIMIETLPVEVRAYAEVEGMIKSIESKFLYKEKQVSGELKPYFGQLHSHTTNSDGAGTVEDAYKYASEKAEDIDFLAVTDHTNSLETKAGTANINDGSSSEKWVYGQEMADKYTSPDNFTAMYAGEMTWSNGTGHINTFNSGGFENRNNEPFKKSTALKTYYEALKTAPESISQLNHPGTTFGDFNDFSHYDPTIDSLITLIEVGNGDGQIGSNGHFPSYEYYQRALDKGWHVGPTNNQDNHKGKWGDANTARSVLLANSLDREDLYDAMRNRRVYATEDQNLTINYTLNGEVMGTIIDNNPSEVNIKVTAKDADNESIGKIKVIANGGKVVAEKTFDSNTVETEFNMPADYSFYYIRIEQADGNIAVTAPVWTGEVLKAGISKSEISTSLPIKDEPFTVSTSIFNNENTNLEIKNIEYSVEGENINTSNELLVIESLTQKEYKFEYTPKKSGNTSINVTVTAELDGVEIIFTDVIKLKITDPKLVTKVVIDGSHYNDYVNGYYGGSMTNFTNIAAKENVQVVIAETITEETLKDAAAFVITPPAKKDGSKNGYEYTAAEFSDEFISIVKDYVDNGGNLMVAGTADYQDNKTEGDDVHQTSTQLNKLLKAIGATTMINNNQVVDKTKNEGQPYRLKFNKYNDKSQYLEGVVKEQVYSFYSGSSVVLDEEAVKNDKVQWLIKGHETTESSEGNSKIPATPVTPGDVCVLASEKLSGGGTMIIGGTIFLSNFEIKAELDNASSLQYINYNIVTNFLDSIKNDIEVSKIADVRKANMGEVFCVEGIVTAGTEPGNAFFDNIYIQDETGGINIFPINDGNIKLGQKVKIVGSVDQYNGDLQLRTISYEVTDKNISLVDPTIMSIKDAINYSYNGGMLVKITGSVKDVELDNGLVSHILVEDNENNVMRVFIDGYIDYSDENSTKLETFAKVGAEISAVGLISNDVDGIRLRVRDRSEIVEVKVVTNPDDSNDNTPNPDDSVNGDGEDNTTPEDNITPEESPENDNSDVEDGQTESNQNKPGNTDKPQGPLVETGGIGNIVFIFIAFTLIGLGIGFIIIRKKSK